MTHQKRNHNHKRVYNYNYDYDRKRDCELLLKWCVLWYHGRCVNCPMRPCPLMAIRIPTRIAQSRI